jgi:hypothetical protein
MNLIKDFTITLDLLKDTKNPLIQVKESDLNAIRFTFKVTDDDVQVDLTDAMVRLAVQKPSGLTVIQDCTITNALTGSCEIILSNQAYLEIGNHRGELVITKGDITVITKSFAYTSTDAIFDDNTMQSTNDWQALHDIMLNYGGIWKGNQAEYDAIATKDPNTLYFVTG